MYHDMVSVSEAFDLARTGNREAAANVLKQEFQRLQSPEQKVELCEWIANCFENLNDYEQAAEWYELAGALALSETGSPLANAMSALAEYEKALSCRERGDDAESIEACLHIIRDLRHVYAAA
jgi:tetratricopeptide (TPR) repeat protein